MEVLHENMAVITPIRWSESRRYILVDSKSTSRLLDLGSVTVSLRKLDDAICCFRV